MVCLKLGPDSTTVLTDASTQSCAMNLTNLSECSGPLCGCGMRSRILDLDTGLHCAMRHHTLNQAEVLGMIKIKNDMKFYQ